MSRIADLDQKAIHVLRRLIAGEDVPLAPYDLPRLRAARDQLFRAGLVTRSRNGKNFELTALGATCRGDIFSLDHGAAARLIEERKKAARVRGLQGRAVEIYDALKELVAASDAPELDDPLHDGHAAAIERNTAAYDVAEAIIKSIDGGE